MKLSMNLGPWLTALLVGTLAACGGGRDPVLGFDGVAAPPTISARNPAAGASNVCTTATIDATFNVPSRLRIDPAIALRAD